MKHLHLIAAVACIFASSLATAADGEIELVVTKNNVGSLYREFTRLTKEPRMISPTLNGACSIEAAERIDERNASFGPHIARALHIYANPAAADAIPTKAAEFPVGAVIVKEKLKLGKRGRYYFSEVGGMIKRAKGYDSANGDWEFFFYTPGGEFSTGKIENCIDCHSGGKRDHVFSLWSLSRPLDPLGRKSAKDAYDDSPMESLLRERGSQISTDVRSVRESLSVAWKQVQGMEHPLLASISDTKPSFVEDTKGVRSARVLFIKNAIWPTKGAEPKPIDPQQPYIWVQVGLWDKDQSAQPTSTTKGIRVGDTDYSLLVLIRSSDPALKTRIESTLFNAFGKTTERAASEQPLPPPAIR